MESGLHLSEKEHAPEIHIKLEHNNAVDMWGIGHLILTSNVTISNKLVDNLKHQLLDEPSQRPPISYVLKELRNIHQGECGNNCFDELDESWNYK